MAFAADGLQLPGWVNFVPSGSGPKRNCTRDEGRSLGAGSQAQASNRKRVRRVIMSSVKPSAAEAIVSTTLLKERDHAPTRPTQPISSPRAVFFSGLSVFIRRSVNSHSCQTSFRRVRFGFFSHEMTVGPPCHPGDVGQYRNRSKIGPRFLEMAASSRQSRWLRSRYHRGPVFDLSRGIGKPW